MVHEFEFRCDKCKQDYNLKDGELTTKTHERDIIAESSGIIHTEATEAVNRRCPQCGGPISKVGLSLRCNYLGVLKGKNKKDDRWLVFSWSRPCFSDHCRNCLSNYDIDVLGLLDAGVGGPHW
jgi:hypothetical protein